MTAVLALPDAPLWPGGTDLSEGTVAVRPTARPADVLLAILPGQTVGVVEADLDANFRLPAGLGLCDAPLAQSTVGVRLTGLETDVSHTGVAGVTASPGTAVARPAAHGCPHTAVLGVWGSVTGDTWHIEGLVKAGSMRGNINLRTRWDSCRWARC